VTGHNFGAFFRRHVYRGERPPLPDLRTPEAPRDPGEPAEVREPGEPDDLP